MKLLVTNNTGFSCRVGSVHIPYIEVLSAFDAKGEQEFDVRDIVQAHWYSRQIKALIPSATVSLSAMESEPLPERAKQAEEPEQKSQQDQHGQPEQKSQPEPEPKPERKAPATQPAKQRATRSRASTTKE